MFQMALFLLEHNNCAKLFKNPCINVQVMARTSSIYDHFDLYMTPISLAFTLHVPEKIFQMALLLLDDNNCAKLFWNPCINVPVMARTSSIYDHFYLYLNPMILTFNLPENMFQIALFLLEDNNCAKLFWNPCINVQVMALTSSIYDHFDLYLTPVTLIFNRPEKMFQMAFLLLEDNNCAKLFWNPCINVQVMARTSSIYDHFDLYLTPVTLIFIGPEKIFQMALPLLEDNNCAKLFWNPCINVQVMARTSSIYDHFDLYMTPITLTFTLHVPEKIFQMALLLLDDNNCAKLFWNPCINVPVMARTSSIYDHFYLYLCPVTLTFNLPENMFQIALLLSEDNNCAKLFWNPCINVQVMARTSSIYDHFDLYLTPVTLIFNRPEKMFQMALLLLKENNCAKLFWNPCINVQVMAWTSSIYDHFDLYLTPVTLIFIGPEKIFKMALPLLEDNNCAKLFWNPCINVQVMARISSIHVRIWLFWPLFDPCDLDLQPT